MNSKFMKISGRKYAMLRGRLFFFSYFGQNICNDTSYYDSGVTGYSETSTILLLYNLDSSLICISYQEDKLSSS